MNEDFLLGHRKQINALGKDLFRLCGVEFHRTSEVQRQISAAFLFGVVFAYGTAHQLSTPQVHALAITMLQDVLAYGADQAGAFSEKLIKASSGGPYDSMNAIIHRGIDALDQLETGRQDALRDNLHGILKGLNAPYFG